MEFETSHDFAQFCAEFGFAIFPLSRGSKYPLKGSHGYKDATTDTDQIERIWGEHPEYNIGLRTGQASGGLLVIDVDVKNDGEEGFQTIHDLEAEYGKFPETVTAVTPSGGEHYYYHTSEIIHTDNHTLYSDIDIHAEEAYIIMPPSVIYDYDNPANAKCYGWEAGFAPDEHPIAEANDAIIEAFIKPLSKTNKLLRKTNSKEERKSQSDNTTQQDKFIVPEQINEGMRNGTLFQAACSLQATGFPDMVVETAIQELNQKCCVPPLSEEETQAIIMSALNRYEKGGGMARWTENSKSLKVEILQSLKEQLAQLYR